MERPTIVETEKIRLSPISKEDLPTYYLRRSEPEMQRYYSLEGSLPYFENVEDWYDRITKSKEAMVFSIISKDTDSMCGVIFLNVIDYENRRAHIGGEIFREYWNKGIATEALGLAKRYSFELLNLRKLYTEVLEPNKASIRVLAKNDFREIGRHKAHSFVPGSGYVDELMFEIFSPSYEK